MSKNEESDQDQDDVLAEELAAYQHDPLGFAENMFPWGEPGTELEHEKIEGWQRAKWDELGKKLRAGLAARDGVLVYLGEVIQQAVASGNGIGKSTYAAITILWAVSTLEDTIGVATANTRTQLITKTWATLGRWFNLFLAKHLFTYTATSIYSSSPVHERIWRFDAIPWRKTSPEAFAGLHNKRRRVVLIFDEASAIPDTIWETAEGALTDEATEIIWVALGNPTRNNGRFYDAFHKLRHRWLGLQVDSRSCGITNKKKIAEWLEDKGAESDWFRVHVKGEFPIQGDLQFIPTHLVEQARNRVVTEGQVSFAPKILTLDAAWTGGDVCACVLRQGISAQILWTQAKNDDDVALAARLAKTEDEVQADAVFIDQAYGTGVYSAGKHMKRKWMLVAFGSAPTDPQYLNKRAEMWALMKKWLQEGGAIPDDPPLAEELVGMEQIFREDGKLQLEKKADFKDRLGFSPDRADALALTFAYPVKSRTVSQNPRREKAEFSKSGKDYDPLGDA